MILMDPALIMALNYYSMSKKILKNRQKKKGTIFHIGSKILSRKENSVTTFLFNAFFPLYNARNLYGYKIVQQFEFLTIKCLHELKSRGTKVCDLMTASISSFNKYRTYYYSIKYIIA